MRPTAASTPTIRRTIFHKKCEPCTRIRINAPLSAFHGELCPANVVVGKDGVARIVSVFRPRPVTITARSEALGYASPETIAAEIEQDARVDIYAAGVMLWEALTERRLYVDTSPSRIAQRIGPRLWRVCA